MNLMCGSNGNSATATIHDIFFFAPSNSNVIKQDGNIRESEFSTEKNIY